MPFLSTRRLLLLSLLIILVAAGTLLWVKPSLWKSWLANRYAGKAEYLQGMGAREAARIAVIKALKLDPNCVRALESILPDASVHDLKTALFIRSKMNGDIGEWVSFS